MSNPVDRLRAFVKHNGYEIVTGTSGRHAVPMDSEQASADLEALLAVVEAAKELLDASRWDDDRHRFDKLEDAVDALYTVEPKDAEGAKP